MILISSIISEYRTRILFKCVKRVVNNHGVFHNNELTQTQQLTRCAPCTEALKSATSKIAI